MYDALKLGNSEGIYIKVQKLFPIISQHVELFLNIPWWGHKMTPIKIPFQEALGWALRTKNVYDSCFNLLFKLK